ncbi:MAG TPA: TMEM14 family protein [bacterium]
MAAYVVLVYGVLVIAGGVMGYAKAKSTPSLISGGLFGVIVIIAALLMLQGNPVGIYVSLAAAFLLLIFFSRRFSTTKKFMPAGLMMALSLITVLTLLTKWLY